MSAREVTDSLVDAIAAGQYDLLWSLRQRRHGWACGAIQRRRAAVEVLDECIGRIEAALLAHGGEGLITADHGNCEQMRDYDNDQPHTQHTTEHVPLIYVGAKGRC